MKGELGLSYINSVPVKVLNHSMPMCVKQVWQVNIALLSRSVTKVPKCVMPGHQALVYGLTALRDGLEV